LTECHAVVLPSFDDYRSYTILVPALNSSAQPLGVRRIWRRRDDLGKFEGPVNRLRHGSKLRPSIDEQDVALLTEDAEAILQRAVKATVPAYVRQSTVFADGEAYVLSFGHLFVSTRFEWSSEPPTGWQPLEVLLKAIADAVESRL